MSKYISLLMLFMLLFFVGCDKREDFTKNMPEVFRNQLREGLVVVDIKDIPETDLSLIVVENDKDPNDARFSLITSRSSKPKIGENVRNVEVFYYLNSDGKLQNLFALASKD